MSGHGHGEVDFEAEMAAGMPPHYCESNWRLVVGGTALASVLVLAMTLHQHFAKLDPPVAENGAPSGTQLAATSPGANSSTVLPVAGVPLMGETGSPALNDPGVRFVGGTQKTRFNTAASSIRPSVMGIRAGFGDPARGRVERIGSGVVVDPRGYVVTCNHVVAQATRVAVTPFGNPAVELPAQLVAVDGDLALLKADGTNFVAATLADSRNVEVGDWILAVGHPFGLGLTVTAGIVGRRRGVLTVPGSRQYNDLFQTDAPINEGSSGGPLVDLSGRVVGINMAIYAPTGVFSGAGFAIPSNRVREFVVQHLGRGALGPAPARAYFGITLADLTQPLSLQLGFSGSGGVVVQAVAPGSPAALAQLSPGDVVTQVAEMPVSDLVTLGRVLAQFKPGDAVQMQVWRGGRWQAHTLRLNSSLGAG